MFYTVRRIDVLGRDVPRISEFYKAEYRGLGFEAE